VSRPLRTWDLRVWTTLDRPGPALARFFAEARELAKAHPGIEVKWLNERVDRQGRPRVRPPPREETT
jgi:hypothetical protein